MPMYEKGSVRAEPRSKQQERMKKIMKKFLSSLLALTLVLSLIVVPARADGSDEISGLRLVASSSVEEGSSTTFSVTGTAKVGNVEVTNLHYTWNTPGFTGTAGDEATTASLTASTVGSQAVTCTVTGKYQKPSDAPNGGTTETAARVVLNATVEIVSASTAFRNAITYIDLNGHRFNVSSSNSFEFNLIGSETLGSATSNLGTGSGVYSGVTYTIADGDSATQKTLTVSGTKGTSPNTTSVRAQFAITVNTVATPAVTVKANGTAYNSSSSPLTIYAGQKIELTASGYDGNNDATYAWSASNSANSPVAGSPATSATWTAPSSASASGDTYTLTCTVTEKGGATTNGVVYVKVLNDPYHSAYANSTREYTIVPSSGTNYCDIDKPVLKGTGVNDITSSDNGYSVKFAVTSGELYVTVDESSGHVTKRSSLTRSGTATIKATITYKSKTYDPLTYTVNISELDSKLNSIVNGDSDSYRQSDIQDKLADAIKKQDSSFRYNNVNTITVVGTPSRVTLKDGKTTLSNGSSVTDGFTIYADEAYIGDASFQLKVNNNYVVTMYLTVDSKGEIKDTVTGTSAGKSVTFTNSDYDYLYIYEGSTSFKSDMYNGDWSKTSYAPRSWKPVAQNKDYTVSSSAFDRNGKATLYVVAVDDDIASTGTITVSQKSYDINYNVVAGKSVTFNQKDFESFLEDYAEDNGNYNPKKDEITFDHAVLTSSIPSAKSEGTLYYGSTEITSSNKSKTDMTDMDKVSFDSVSKPSKDTVTLTFRVYGEIEKPNSRKPDKVNYDVNVVISVVKEDITYTVGIDDTVQLTARDFVNFLQDAKTSYRKSTLDYVKFDVSGKNVSSYAYGGLYRSYSSYSTGKLADSTDKFYYEPSRTQYDLADVAYHTTRWAEAGKTVYIPFTVYGTKNEEASGTMAITIAQTMNFIDVKASDFFYEPVKWAVNNKITNGTSSTTFSPYKNCNRAEIVTFLWRAAGSPEPTVTRNPFTDVNSVRDASYYKAILWASQKGITAGTNATTFSPYQECTRPQIVTFLYRYAGKPSGNYTNPFKDVSSVNEASYYNAILWAVGKGITQGTSTTTFSPYASCTRGEAVTFLYRYVNGVK